MIVQNTNDIGGRLSWPREVQVGLEQFVAGGGGFQTLLIRAIEWLHDGKVTWPLPDDFSDASRIRLCGGMTR